MEPIAEEVNIQFTPVSWEDFLVYCETGEKIKLETWDTGAAKSLDHLKAEIEIGESVLVKDSSGEIIRKLSVANARIIYTNFEGTYQLYEDRQEFTDGRPRNRPHLTSDGISISEKMFPDETPKGAIIRAIGEELNIIGDFAFDDEPIEDQRFLESRSFPGLKTIYKTYLFDVVIGPEAYNPKGYVEKQQDKSTFFVWKEILGD